LYVSIAVPGKLEDIDLGTIFPDWPTHGRLQVICENGFANSPMFLDQHFVGIESNVLITNLHLWLVLSRVKGWDLG